MELTTSEQYLWAIKVLAVAICVICALFWFVLQVVRKRLEEVKADRDIWRERCLAHKTTINASSGDAIRKEMEERPRVIEPGTATVHNARKAQDKINQRRFKGDGENGRNKHGRYGEPNPDLVVASTTLASGMVMAEVIDEIGDMLEGSQDDEPNFDVQPMGVSGLEESGTTFSDWKQEPECEPVQEPAADSYASDSDSSYD